MVDSGSLPTAARSVRERRLHAQLWISLPLLAASMTQLPVNCRLSWPHRGSDYCLKSMGNLVGDECFLVVHRNCSIMTKVLSRQFQ